MYVLGIFAHALYILGIFACIFTEYDRMRSAEQNLEEFWAEVVPNVTLYCRNEDIEEKIRKERCDLNTHHKQNDQIYILSLNESGLAE